jgi:hypothetical protein
MQERATPAISGFPKPLPTHWFKRVLTRQPQVDEINPQEIWVPHGQSGIAIETVRAGRSYPRWHTGVRPHIGRLWHDG